MYGYIYIYIYISVHIYIYIYIRTYTFIHIYIHTFIYIYINVWMYMCMNVWMYKNMYTTRELDIYIYYKCISLLFIFSRVMESASPAQAMLVRNKSPVEFPRQPSENVRYRKHWANATKHGSLMLNTSLIFLQMKW